MKGTALDSILFNKAVRVEMPHMRDLLDKRANKIPVQKKWLFTNEEIRRLDITSNL